MLFSRRPSELPTTHPTAGWTGACLYKHYSPGHKTPLQCASAWNEMAQEKWVYNTFVFQPFYEQKHLLWLPVCFSMCIPKAVHSLSLLCFLIVALSFFLSFFLSIYLSFFLFLYTATPSLEDYEQVNNSTPDLQNEPPWHQVTTKGIFILHRECLSLHWGQPHPIRRTASFCNCHSKQRQKWNVFRDLPCYLDEYDDTLTASQKVITSQTD